MPDTKNIQRTYFIPFNINTYFKKAYFKEPSGIASQIIFIDRTSD
jgi:hypothetical protein